MGGLPEYLPLLDGWEHLWKTFIPGEIKPIPAGNIFHLVEEKEAGWGWAVTVISRSNAFWELRIAVDESTERHNALVSTPFQAFTYGFTAPNDHIWTPFAAYVAGLFTLMFCPAEYKPYRKFVDISVRAADRNPVTGAPIVVPLVIDGALVVRIKITDEEAFKRSVRELSAPI